MPLLPCRNKAETMEAAASCDAAPLLLTQFAPACYYERPTISAAENTVSRSPARQISPPEAAGKWWLRFSPIIFQGYFGNDKRLSRSVKRLFESAVPLATSRGLIFGLIAMVFGSSLHTTTTPTTYHRGGPPKRTQVRSGRETDEKRRRRRQVFLHGHFLRLLRIGHPLRESTAAESYSRFFSDRRSKRASERRLSLK